MSDAPRDEFYVGYLPVPARQRRFLWYIGAGLVFLIGAAALVIAVTQTDPGPAVWEGEPRVVRGVIIERPYPMLMDGAGGVYLLVAEGKHRADVSGFGGLMTEVTGTLLSRESPAGTGRMLEVTRLVSSDSTPPNTVFAADLGPMTLRGEIVDSKCYMGAMKPGNGRTHKECATLCIAGGIPPVLVLDDGGFVVLASADGGPLSHDYLPLVAERVEASGRVEEVAGMRLMRAERLEKR